MKAKATVHGAVSIVNAIATGRGATLGTEQRVTATAESGPGRGISIEATRGSPSSRLIIKTAERIVPRRSLERNKITISVETDIPTGYGLKSSSAISSAVALACSRLFREKSDDQRILLAGVEASIQTKVSITGAYDDACACYFGGFNVTDNRRRRRVRHENGPRNMSAVIFVPRARRRGNVKRLRVLKPVFEKAWVMASEGSYWDAMNLNGLATSAILRSDPGIIADLLEKGAIAASVSGNGPAIAAIARRDSLAGVKKVFGEREGRVVVTGINNRKADVRLV